MPGTGKLLDTEHGVHIGVLSAGRSPGDDKPKPIAFPDPTTTAIRGAPFAMLPVARWIELELASGMVAKHRLKDLADVQELIRSAGETQLSLAYRRGAARRGGSRGTPWRR